MDIKTDILFVGYKSDILDPLIHDPPSPAIPTTEHYAQTRDTNDGHQYPQHNPHNGGDAQVQDTAQLVQFVAAVATIVVLVTDEIHGDTAAIRALEFIGVARTIVIRRDNCFKTDVSLLKVT